MSHTSNKAAPGVWLHGSSGRMGKEIQKAVAEGAATQHGLRLVGGSARTFEGEQFYQGRQVTADLLAHVLIKDDIALILDFSTPEANAILLAALGKVTAKAVLIGTTGLTTKQLAAWRQTATEQQLRVLLAPNTSIGILLAAKAALQLAAPLLPLGFDIEITETHHRAKRDAPSGTARFLAESIATAAPGLKIVTDRQGGREAGEIGVHSVRGGGVFGEHEIRFIGEAEEIRISHRAFSRALFAQGALVLGRWLLQQKAGIYALTDVSL